MQILFPRKQELLSFNNFHMKRLKHRMLDIAFELAYAWKTQESKKS